jgi:hypothetical protein
VSYQPNSHVGPLFVLENGFNLGWNRLSKFGRFIIYHHSGNLGAHERDEDRNRIADSPSVHVSPS